MSGQHHPSSQRIRGWQLVSPVNTHRPASRLGHMLCIALLAALGMLGGCSVKYSFSGASISPDTHTVSVIAFQNVAPLINPTLAASITDKLKERLQNQTRLDPVNQGGDLNFEGEITEYAVGPTAILGNETAAQNRFTIAVQVRFTDAQNPAANFERTFAVYEDFPSSEPFQQVEQQLAEAILDRLTEEIFNAALANW